MKEHPGLRLWHFATGFIAIAVILSEVIVCGMSFAFHGRITRDYFITGAVAALLVSTSVISIIFYFIRQLRRAEEALRESRERYLGLFEDSPLSLWEIDFSGVKSHLERIRRRGTDPDPPMGRKALLSCLVRIKISDVNRAAVALHEGGNKHDFLRHAGKILCVESEEFLKDFFRALVEEKSSYEGETIVQSLTGRKIHVAVRWGVLPGHERTAAKSLLSLSDITERKRIEAQLLRSEKLAATGQLAAGLAHEINNPLGVILGFAQGAVHRIAPGDLLEMPLKSIEREAVRCKNLVQDLLTFSRAFQAEREFLSLKQAVESAIPLVEARAKMENVLIRKQLAPDLPRILGNKNQIQQVVINLANNALDAMAQAGTLTIATELLKEGPLPWVCLRVSDTGSGIPAEALPHIFEPFFTTKPVGKGTGLGLSLVYEIVKKHSGTVDVQSRPGFTEFCIKFPGKTGDQPETPPFSASPKLGRFF